MISTDIGSPSYITNTGLYLEGLFEIMNSVTVHILNLFGRDPKGSYYYHRTYS